MFGKAKHDDSPRPEHIEALRAQVKGKHTVRESVETLFGGLADQGDMVLAALRGAYAKDPAGFDVERLFDAIGAHVQNLRAAAKMAADDVLEGTGVK